MSEGVLQLHFQLHKVLPQISVHHLGSILHRVRAVVPQHCDIILGRRVGPGASGELFLPLDEFGDVCSSKDWGTRAAREWRLLRLLHDGAGQVLDELPLIVCMIGRGVGRRSSAGGGSGLASGSSNKGSGTATGTCGGSGLGVFS